MSHRTLPSQWQHCGPAVFRWSALIALTCALTGVAAASATQQDLDPADVDAFVSGLMRSAMADRHIPGAAVAVTQNDQVILLKGYGFSDVQAGVHVDPERTLFRVASISKPFIWMSVLQLRDRGMLELDRDINDYLDFHIPDTYPGQPVTLRHLLTHTAGFEDVNIGASVRSKTEREPLEETVRRMQPRRVSAPGVRSAYSNYGTAVAGLIVQRVSQQPLTEYLAEHVYAPAGMDRSTMVQPPPAAIDGELATGYTLAGRTLESRPFEHMNLYPNGAMSTTAADMARFAITQMQHESNPWGLSADSRTEMHTRQFAMLPQGAGLTHGFAQSLLNGHKAIGHGGDLATFKAQFLMFPESRIGLFIAFNSDQTGDAATRIIAEFAKRYLSPTGDALFSDEPLTNGTDDFSGTFVPSRRNHSTLEKLFWPMTTGLQVRRTSQTDLLLEFQGTQRRYQRVATGVYMPAADELGRSDRLGALLAQRSPDGDGTQLFFSQIGVFMFEPPSRSEALPLHRSLLTLVIGALLAGAVLGLVGALSSRGSPTARASSLAATLAAVTALAFLPLLGNRFTPELVYGVDDPLRLVLTLPLVSTAVMIGALVLLAVSWRGGGPSRPGAAGVVFTLIGLATLLWQLQVWNLLGHAGVPA